MNDLVKIIMDYGISIGMIVYFIYKDYKFTQNITSCLAKLEELIEQTKN